MTRSRCRSLVVACSLLLVAPGALCAESKPHAAVEGITEHRLPNGLQILLFPDPSKPTFTVNVTYYVGSRHEGRGEKGMAHLLEHMVFKGTPTHPDIWRSLEDHGASFNGTTWVDRTNYYETLPSEPGNLAWALAMEADRMVNSNIAAEDLATEFSVVRNEFEMGENDPTSVLWERMVSAAYIWHNYGDSTIGSKSDIERVPVENLRAFYDRYYQPDNATVVVAGDFDPDEALAIIRREFGRIPRPSRTLADTYTVEPIQDGARHVELERVGDVAAVGTVYHIPAASHEDYAPVAVLQEIFTDEPGGRLYRALVEPGLASSLFGIAFGWREPGIAVNLAQVPEGGSPRKVLDTMIAGVEGTGKQAATKEEVERAKRALLKDFELDMKDSERIGIEISEWAAAGDWRLMFLHRDRLEAVTLQDVRNVATRYFLGTNRTSGMFLPRKASEIRRAEIPSAPDVAALLDGYEGREAIAEGEAFEMSPENIETRVSRVEMPNGMRLAMLPKETRGDAVTARLTLRFGSADSLAGRSAVARMVPDLLTRGTKRRDYQQLRDRLDELKAEVSIGGSRSLGAGPNVIEVSVNTDRAHLEPALDLVYEMLTESTFPESEFDIVKQETLTELEDRLNDPQALAFNHVFRELNPYDKGDVRYVPTLDERIRETRAITVKDLREFHRKFLGASHAQMTIVGDFAPEAVEAAARKTYGRWSSSAPYRRIERDYRKIAGEEETIRTPDKKMAMVACGLNVEVRDDDDAYPALRMSNYILGASAKSRLLERLRQKEGLSYGAGSMLAADSEDRTAMFAGMAIAAPENAAKAQASLVDEFRRLVGGELTAEELEDAKKSYALQVRTRMAEDGNVAAMLNEGLYLGRTMEYYAKLYAAIDALTVERIRQALKEKVDLAGMVRVKAGDLQ